MSWHHGGGNGAFLAKARGVKGEKAFNHSQHHAWDNLKQAGVLNSAGEPEGDPDAWDALLEVEYLSDKWHKLRDDIHDFDHVVPRFIRFAFCVTPGQPIPPIEIDLESPEGKAFHSKAVIDMWWNRAELAKADAESRPAEESGLVKFEHESEPLTKRTDRARHKRAAKMLDKKRTQLRPPTKPIKLLPRPRDAATPYGRPDCADYLAANGIMAKNATVSYGGQTMEVGNIEIDPGMEPLAIGPKQQTVTIRGTVK